MKIHRDIHAIPLFFDYKMPCSSTLNLLRIFIWQNVNKLHKFFIIKFGRFFYMFFFRCFFLFLPLRFWISFMCTLSRLKQKLIILKDYKIRINQIELKLCVSSFDSSDFKLDRIVSVYVTRRIKKKINSTIRVWLTFNKFNSVFCLKYRQTFDI